MNRRRTKLREIFYSAEKVPEVFFYTSNESKFLQARLVFSRAGLRLRHFPTHTEPYDEDYSKGREQLLAVAVEQVRRLTGGNAIFFVEDTSVEINALSVNEEFPGLAVKEWFSATSFAELDRQLLNSGNNRAATVKSDIALSLPGLPQSILIHGETVGLVADHPPSYPPNPQHPWLTPDTFNGWFVPVGSGNKTLGEMSFEESISFDFRVRALDKVLDRIEEYTAILNLPSGAYSRRRKQAPSGQLVLMPNVRRAIAVVGKTCAGKSTFGEYAGERGFLWIEASDVVRSIRDQSVEKLDSTEAFAKYLLGTSGADVVARRVLRLLELDADTPFVVTGFRALEEVELLKREVPQVQVILVRSSDRTRYERFLARNRDGSPLSLSDFRKRDMSQWDFGLLSVAEDFADVIIENEGTLDDYFAQVDSVLSETYGLASVLQDPHSSRVTPAGQLVRCLRVLDEAGRVLDCNEISDGTADTGARIRFNNVNKIVKRYPSLAKRFDADGEKVRYGITDAGRTYLRMIRSKP